jgi:predicted dehydrogenase
MLNANNPVGVGIVGLSAKGGWAATAHVPALRAMPERFSILGLAASTHESAVAAAKAHGVPFATEDPAALANRPEVGLLVVTVKVPHHRELVAHALDAGKAVYCEWPLGQDLQEAQGMAAAADARGVPAFAGLQGRSAPAVRYLRDLINDGFVGGVLSTSVIGSGGFPWGGTATTRTAYVLDGTTGATMLTIPFGHMIDAFTWTLGGFDRLKATLATRHRTVHLLDADRAVTATAPDQVVVSGVLASGAVASLQYRGGDSPATNFLWEINGTEGTLLAEANSGHLQYGHIRLSGCRGNQPLALLSPPARYRQATTDPSGYADAVAHAYHGVHDELTTGSSSVPTFSDAVETHRLLDRIEGAADWFQERK